MPTMTSTRKQPKPPPWPLSMRRARRARVSIGTCMVHLEDAPVYPLPHPPARMPTFPRQDVTHDGPRRIPTSPWQAHGTVLRPDALPGVRDPAGGHQLRRLHPGGGRAAHGTDAPGDPRPGHQPARLAALRHRQFRQGRPGAAGPAQFRHGHHHRPPGRHGGGGPGRGGQGAGAGRAGGGAGGARLGSAPAGGPARLGPGGLGIPVAGRREVPVRHDQAAGGHPQPGPRLWSGGCAPSSWWRTTSASTRSSSPTSMRK